MPRVLFDRGPTTQGALFEGALGEIRAQGPEDVANAFAQMEAAQAAGHWLAGFASYELGYALTEKLAPLMPETRALPLLHFGIFDAPGPAPRAGRGRARLTDRAPLWDATAYARAFERVQAYIRAGDIYQANLTFPIRAKVDGDMRALYDSLSRRQTVPHGALLEFDRYTLLSRSPELFFWRTAEGQLTTRPMKGTAPRGSTPVEDDRLRDDLQGSEKNRAENLMIVDLLRNDMSRVSEVGSVKVPSLFAIERYATLHQMTSTVTSRLLPDVTLANLFTALFPCGSITGAPKIRAMEIIRELEPSPREAYCGGIGWIAPSGAMEFNVAIRTLLWQGGDEVVLNVGGGVVYDSGAGDEYDEALLKARFAFNG